MASTSEDPFRVLTWNLLSPGYFRKADRASRKRMEASHPAAWEARFGQQLRILVELRPAVACLQELWQKPAIFSMIDAALGGQYHVRTMQRGSKKEDGCALLVRRDFDVLESRCMQFSDAGDRVLVLALLRSCVPSHTLVVGTTHFTFPHDESDDALRLHQAAATLEALAAFEAEMRIAHSHTGSTVLCGDLNGTADDPAVAAVMRGGRFRSAFSRVHSREPGVTHMNHEGVSTCVDYVLYRGEGLSPAAAWLLPRGVPDDALMTRPVVQTADDIRAAAVAASTGSASPPVMPLSPSDSAAAAAPNGGPLVVALISPVAVNSPTSPALVAQEEEGDPRVGRFAVSRSLAGLGFGDFCDLSDHRALCCEFHFSGS